jgi:DMSO/TMAO reductase YedYZ molybdopterin-dependent catalytic subunit
VAVARHTGVMGFFERNRAELVERGYDPARLPPGQYLTDRFPVLHVGDVPTYDTEPWDLQVTGLVDRPFRLDVAELKALPPVTLTRDIHCVTKWSKFDTSWTGVRVRDLFERAGVQVEATHVMVHAEYGYTTNLPLDDITRDDSIVAYAFDGEPIEPIHGGPVRLVIPHLYFWKSAKWVRALELRAGDEPGFWERNGYHIYGDPFREQRYWGDD